jgi:hypothetical protein
MATLAERIADLATRIGQEVKAVSGRIPLAGNAIPRPEVGSGSAGTATAFAREDHAHPLAPVTTVALAQFTVTNNVVASVSLYGVSGVTRISAGRYRCNFSVAQPDTAYNPRSDCMEPSTTTAKFSRIGVKTTTYVEILVSQVTLLSGVLSMAAADAPEVFFDVARKT